MAAGWFKVHRSLLDHPIMQDDWHCRLFRWCLLKANWKPSEFKGQLLLPGQFVTGRNSGSDELNVSPSKFKRGLDVLADRFGCIALQPNNQFTTVTVCNWSLYQEPDDTERTTYEQPVTQPANNERTAEDTTDGHIQRREELLKRKESKNQTPTPKPPPDEWKVVEEKLRVFNFL